MLNAAAAVRPSSAREVWNVAPEELGPDGRLAPAALVARTVSAAGRLLARAQLVAVSVEELKVVSAVGQGAELVITVALEREDARELAVSVVVRHGEPGAQRGVAVLGILRFAVLASGWAPSQATSLLQHTARRGAGLGLTPVEARFRSDAAPDALAKGSLVAWVQETSLVSAQGFARGSVELEVVHAMSVLAPARLQCSVVHAEGGRVTVLSHLTDDGSGADVLCALTSFRGSRLFERSRPDSPLADELERFHALAEAAAQA